MNNHVHQLLYALRSHTSITPLITIGGYSRDRVLSYHSLRQGRHWSVLRDACLTDIQHAEGYADGLIGVARQERALAADTTRFVRVLKRMLDEADKTSPDKSPAGATDVDLAPIRELVGKAHVLRPNYGGLVVTSANVFVLLESAAVESLVQAELHQKKPAFEKPGVVAKITESFWSDPQIDDVFTIFGEYRSQLATHLKEVYFAVLNDRRTLSDKLSSLTNWISRRVVGVVRLQQVVSTLLKDPRSRQNKSGTLALSSLSIDVGILIREMIASHTAALIGSLSVNGINFNRDAIEVLSTYRARSTPFDCGWPGAKRASVERLGSLSAGMRVSVQGILNTAEFVGGEGDYFMGELRDFTEPFTAQVAVPVDLLAHGLADGCHVRVCGVIQEDDKRRHLKIEKFNTRESSAENWKLAFQNLSSPYFSTWPGGSHVAFELLPVREIGLERGGNAQVQATCDAERAEVDKATKDYNLKQDELLIVYCAAILTFPELAWADAASIAIAVLELHAAQDALQAAQAAYYACLGIVNPGGTSGTGGVSDPSPAFDSASLVSEDSEGSAPSAGSVGSVGSGGFGDSEGDSSGG
jgi:hypothetical protein